MIQTKHQLACRPDGLFENNQLIYVFLLSWSNFILKEWLTISRGAEPSAQNPKLENRKKITE